MNEDTPRFLKYNYNLTDVKYIHFKCNICGELFARPNNASMEDDEALSISLKVHDRSHDYHNDWITQPRQDSVEIK